VKEMRDKKFTGDILTLLGEDGLGQMTQLIDMCDSREWPKNFSEITVTALKKKPNATKHNDHHTISLILHAAKIVVRIFRGRFGRKIEDTLGGNQFGFRR